MKKILLPLSFFMILELNAQDPIDTTFTVQELTCHCKYNLDSKKDSRIFERSQVPAFYPGGADQWKKFLKKNLMDKMKGWHEVQFRFEVSKDGELSSFLLLNDAPVEKFNEVVRVMQLSGKWFPALQGGYCVKSIVRMMIEL